MNVRECNLCHKMVDFDEPWCDHETMEESAWLEIHERIGNSGVDRAVYFAAEELKKKTNS